MCWLAKIMLAACCAGMLISSACPREQEEQEREARIPVYVEIDWNADNDLNNDFDQDFPSTSISGGLLAVSEKGRPLQPFKVDSNLREIGELQYTGLELYHGPAAEAKDPAALVFDVYMRRFADPTSLIDIHLSSKSRCQLLFKDFEGGILREAATEKILERPYVFNPGDYHLRASMK